MTESNKETVNIPITLAELIAEWDVYSSSTKEYGVTIPFWTFHRVLTTLGMTINDV